MKLKHNSRYQNGFGQTVKIVELPEIGFMSKGILRTFKYSREGKCLDGSKFHNLKEIAENE